MIKVLKKQIFFSIFVSCLLLLFPIYNQAINHTGLSISGYTDISSLQLTKPTLNYSYTANYHTKTPISIEQPTAQTNSFKQRCDFRDCRFVKISSIPLLFVAAGAFSWNAREKYRETRNRYVPDFNNNYDDYLQYGSTISYYALNLSGIKGKHTVGRATMNFLYGQVIMHLTDYLLKNTTHVLRPDGRAYNSFPSGHTATAFAGATFLHKEYGQYRDPMYSLFGYAMATGTGMGRQLNNRHWVSDVLVGAGIGILSTELGYWIGDKIHGNKGTYQQLDKKGLLSANINPSFIEMKLGTAWPLEHELPNENHLNMCNGFTTAIEGAYFFNRNIGIGGAISLSSIPFSKETLSIDNTNVQQIASGTYSQALGGKGFCIGPFFDFPLSPKWSFATKLIAGYGKGVKGSLSVNVKPEYQQAFGQRLVVEQYKPGESLVVTTGISIRRIISQTVSVRGYLDYFHSNPTWNVSTIKNVNLQTGAYEMDEYVNQGRLSANCLTAGFALTAIIW
jgi:hypothetical protein